jgi:predicted dehydrogenase
MNDKLKVGVVGASGWMAGALSAGAEYGPEGFNPETGVGEKNEMSTVTALCDLNADAMKERKKELKLDNAGLFTSYDEMLSSDSVDAVVVAVPNNLHATFAIKALEAGKHLFLEKPFATTEEGSKALLEAVAKTDVTTKIDYILCHYDEQEKLRKLISESAFGELASTHFTYRHPIEVGKSARQTWKLSKKISGGAIPMGICHAVSLTVFQVDSDPVSVICKSSPAKIREFEYDTQQDILVTFANGVTGLIQGNIDFAEKYDARHTIIGTGGQFDYNPYNPMESRVMWSSESMKRRYSPDPDFAEDHLDSGDVWKHKCTKTIQDFVSYASRGEKDPVLGLNTPTVKRIESIIWAAEKSAATGSAPVEIK